MFSFNGTRQKKKENILPFHKHLVNIQQRIESVIEMESNANSKFEESLHSIHINTVVSVKQRPCTGLGNPAGFRPCKPDTARLAFKAGA